MKHTITITVSDEVLWHRSSEYILLLWNAAQLDETGTETERNALKSQVEHEIIRRWVKQEAGR